LANFFIFAKPNIDMSQQAVSAAIIQNSSQEIFPKKQNSQSQGS
jgi:hypothetical protein